MPEDQMEKVMAHISALQFALVSVISVLPPRSARAAADQLGASIDVERQAEAADPEGAAVHVATRDELLAGYLALLESRSRS